MQKYSSHIRAFTLIELLIVITIIGIISVTTYIPYAHHQKKVLLNQAAREVSQSLRDARSLAINGFNTWSWNVSVALFFWSGSNEIVYYTYPFEQSISLSDFSSGEVYLTKKLPKWVEIESIGWSSQDVLMSFEAISWSGSVEPFLGSWSIDILTSYAGSTESVLQKEIRYYPRSYISDY